MRGISTMFVGRHGHPCLPRCIHLKSRRCRLPSTVQGAAGERCHLVWRVCAVQGTVLLLLHGCCISCSCAAHLHVRLPAPTFPARLACATCSPTTINTRGQERPNPWVWRVRQLQQFLASYVPPSQAPPPAQQAAAAAAAATAGVVPTLGQPAREVYSFSPVARPSGQAAAAAALPPGTIVAGPPAEEEEVVSPEQAAARGEGSAGSGEGGAVS